jgi:hypothetical protein
LFNFFKNTGRTNKVWKILNEKYFNSLDGKIGNTVIKIKEDRFAGNKLLVHTDNENVKSILVKNESPIINEINNNIGIVLTGITII